ncbi:hypothetical protein ACIBU0_33660 [Streptomyces sp. NPDC049627]|uniref:hypothetical protein n=1 Tax=Streptomyces sp. NPDC049627 TaxID=3365595 RepID=UPI0037B3ADAD
MNDRITSDHPHTSEFEPALPATAVGIGAVPLAEPIETGEDMGSGEVSPGGVSPSAEFADHPETAPFPPFPFPRVGLSQGCYELTILPSPALVSYRGTLRVERKGTSTTASGDLYRFLNLPFPLPVSGNGHAGAVESGHSPAVLASLEPMALGRREIPVHPRNKYYSYLKVTGIRHSPLFPPGPRQVTLTVEEYRYTQPSPGSFNGTFPSSPSRTFTMVLHPVPAPPILGGPTFEGSLMEAGTPRGRVTMRWVSPYFRRATVEVDTLAGAVAPQPVSDASGTGTEDIRTAFASANWDVSVEYDQTGIPVPDGVTSTNCWNNADLHQLMQAVRKPTTDLDKEWRMHLVVVPAKLGCGRGLMYDTIDVPREGVASFCDDGYPSNESQFFGSAADQRQRNVPRAFMRSACHELGHGFNQVHQEQEGGADNSIMTTTPSVANVLGGPPGVFPTDINLAFNEHVRHHLIHWPDPAVRPGGMTFGSGHSSSVPSADRLYFSPDELHLKLEVDHDKIDLGEPLRLSWTLSNRTSLPIPVPSDLGVEAQHAFVRITDPQGRQKTLRSLVIRTDHVALQPLEANSDRRAEARVYWDSDGFAFATPGRHLVEVELLWAQGTVPVGARATAEIWVNYPQSRTDNDVAATLLHPEVGKYVALGGAPHLREAVNRLDSVTRISAAGDQPEPGALRGYEGIMPSALVHH